MYWLIAERDSFRMSVYTVQGDGTLPVFSHEREAASFLRLRGLRDGWRTRETSVGELVSLLLGPYAYVSGITLRPANDAGPLAGLVSVERKAFVDFLMQDCPADAAEIGAGN